MPKKRKRIKVIEVTTIENGKIVTRIVKKTTTTITKKK